MKTVPFLYVKKRWCEYVCTSFFKTKIWKRRL